MHLVFYGYHTDWLEVWLEGAETEYCDSTTSQEYEWCTYYENTNSSSSGEYISKVDDYYDDWASKIEAVQEEIFEIDSVAGKTSVVYVSHWYNNTNSKGEFKCWSDHNMLAATLKIVRISEGFIRTVMDKEGNSGWKNAVSKEVLTHIRDENDNDDDSVMNPEYEGEFSLLVTCDEEG